MKSVGFEGDGLVCHSCGIFRRRLLSKLGRRTDCCSINIYCMDKSLLKLDSKGKVDFKEDLIHPNTLGDKAYR